MDSGIVDYKRRSTVLLEAADRFEDSFGNEGRRQAAATDLIGAAERDSFAGVRLGLEARPDEEPPARPPSGSPRFCSICNPAIC